MEDESPHPCGGFFVSTTGQTAMTNDILKKLEEINAEVKQIAGRRQFCYGRFLPSTKVMFVAEMPSFNKHWNPRNNFFISNTDKLFVQILTKYGFGGSYITDIVKTCASVGDLMPDEVEKFKPILLKEIEILKPRLVVAVGRRAFDVMNSIKSKVPLYEKSLGHPARLRFPSHVPVFEWQVKQLRKFCLSI